MLPCCRRGPGLIAVIALAVLSAATATSPRDAAASKPVRAAAAREAKVSAYIEIINDESNHVLRNLDSYAGHIEDVQAGPTCKEGGPQSWVSSMGPNAAERIARYRKGLARPPALPGDAPAGEMVEALAALRPVVEEASEYYYSSKFNEDGCARGKAMHPLLMNGFSRYVRADRALRAWLDQYTDERDAAELVTQEKQYGRGLHYYHRKVMVDAKPLMRAARGQPIDAAAIKSRLAAFVPTVEATEAAVKAVRTPRNSDAIYQGGYEQFVGSAKAFGNQAEDFLKLLARQETEEAEAAAKDARDASAPGARPGQAQKVRERAAARAKFAEEERGRGLENLITTYNYLVQMSNQVMYSKSMK